MSNSNSKAIRTEVPLGNILIEGYLLPEKLWTPTNKFGVSKTQAVLLAYPEYDRNQAAKRYKRIVESREANSPSVFETINGLKPCVVSINLHPGVEVDANGRDARKVDLLSADSIVPFLKICKKLGSHAADEMIDSLAGLSIQQVFSDAFGLQFEKDERQDWLKKRQEGKSVRLDLTDAIAWYKEKHKDTLSDGDKHWMYSNCSDALNIGIFGRTAKKLCIDLEVKDRKKLRDALTADELRWISQVEELGARLVVHQEMKPLDAIKESLARNIIPVVTRKAEKAQ